MEAQEITTGENKMIADFMAFKKISGDTYIGSRKLKYLFYLPKNLWYIDEEGDVVEEFGEEENKFSTDWNWLMQIIEKIRVINQTATGKFKVKLLSYQRNNKNIFDSSILEGKEYVYKLCLDFIKWHKVNK